MWLEKNLIVSRPKDEIIVITTTTATLEEKEYWKTKTVKYLSWIKYCSLVTNFKNEPFRCFQKPVSWEENGIMEKKENKGLTSL